MNDNTEQSVPGRFLTGVTPLVYDLQFIPDAHGSGSVVQALWGYYDRQPYSESSVKTIFVARRA